MPRRKTAIRSETTVDTPVLNDTPSYSELVNVGCEKNQDLITKLQPVANNQQTALLAFIAPTFGKKTSPIDLQSASIGFWEELGIEEAVRNIQKDQNIRKLFLLVESRGGGVDSSYKIAHHLRYNFEEIITFVPHVAASGGTLIALSGNKVVMGEMANLTPIDVQVYYAGTRVSVNRMSSALARLVKYFEKDLPEQVPYPYRVMAEKFDPIIFDDWNTKTNGMMSYTIDILSKTGYTPDRIVKIISNLILTDKPHTFVIHKSLATEYGIEVVQNSDYSTELSCMKWWLKRYMLNIGSQHYIRYVIPTPQHTQQTLVTDQQVPSHAPNSAST